MIRLLPAAAIAAAISVSFALAQQGPPRVILLVGPPGSGKTTQANLLAKKYGVPSVSMADLLKKETASNKDPISKALATSMASGETLTDEAAANLVRMRLVRRDHSKGFILDGFPATAGQAKALDRILTDQQLPKAIVVVLDVSDEMIRKRMLARGRKDDKPEIIERRIQEFRDEAALLVGWAGQTRVIRVDASASVDKVSKAIVAGLEGAWSAQASTGIPR